MKITTSNTLKWVCKQHQSWNSLILFLNWKKLKEHFKWQSLKVRCKCTCNLWNLSYVCYIYSIVLSTMRCITAIKMLFLYFNFIESIKLDSLSCSFTLISFLTFWTILMFSSSDFHSPWNENLNLLLQIKFLNLLVYV
jgi:uncharacterized membrane protein